MRSVLVGVLTVPLFWVPGRQSVEPPDGAVTLVEHGRYIVQRVSMCFECHTPRDERGELRREDWLLGAPIPVSPPRFDEANWAMRAPRIAGMPGYSADEGIRLLTRGIDRTGQSLRPPMPPFRLSEGDARAIVSYLRTAGTPSGP